MQNQKLTLFATLTLMVVFSLAAFAQFDYNTISIDITANPAAAAPGSEGFIDILVSVPFGFSITDIEGVFDIAPLAEVDGVTFGKLIKPEPDHFDEVGGHFEGDSSFQLPYAIDADREDGVITFQLGFVFQACNTMDGMCFMPTDLETMPREVSITVDSNAVASVSTTEQPKAAGDGSLEDIFAGALDGGNFWMAILLAVVAGILTSLTPCIYPMIPITISFVSGKAEGKTRNGFFISLVLVLGIAITYSILGVGSALVGGTFGAMINHWVVQLILTVVLVAMGFSMLGYFEIAMPSKLTNKMAVSKSGYGSALFVGLTIGLVAAPCVAPILVIMLTWIANTQDVFLGFILMFSYAIGMGLLFLIVGTFSNAMLPKSGNWMDYLKRIFAFVFFIMAMVYGQGLINAVYPNLHLYIIGALLVMMGGVLGAFYKVENDNKLGGIVGKSLGLLSAIAGVIIFASGLIQIFLPVGNFAASGAAGSENATVSGPDWVIGLEEGLKLAEESGKPFLIDVGAAWCIACHELEEFTFSDAKVIGELDERFISIKVDEADANYEEVRTFFAGKGYPIVGLPAVMIADSDGNVVEVVNKFINADEMLAKIQAVQ